MEIEKILCVKEVIFRKLQKDFQRFLKANKAPKEKAVKKLKIKPEQKINVPKGHFEPSNLADNMGLSRNHRKGRMNDWHSTYGQGMYE